MGFFEYMCDMTGFKPQTTFWTDFAIAERFGEDAILNTYRRVFEAWKNDYKFLTELIMVLNWKIWYWHDRYDEYESIYSELWAKTDNWALDNLKDEELNYFLRTVD